MEEMSKKGREYFFVDYIWNDKFSRPQGVKVEKIRQQKVVEIGLNNFNPKSRSDNS